MRQTLIIGALTLTFAAPAVAQQRQLTVEAAFTRGALGYARETSARLYAGLEIGFGFPQLDRTLRPAQDSVGSPDFEEYLHIALFLRSIPSKNFEFDGGIRASIADLWPCRASDCLPTGFIGVYVQPMVGWRRVKFGPRLTTGWIAETEGTSRTQGDGSTWVVALSPLNGRLTVAW